MRDGLNRRGVGFRRGNHFQQAHVARRIEEMRPEPVAAKILAEALGDAGHGQAAGVGGDDAAGLAHGFNFLEQAALDLQVLGDGFDDPIGVGQQLQVVIKIADGDQPFQSFFKECCRLGFDGCIQSGGNDLSARGLVSTLGGVRRHDIEQHAGTPALAK